MNLTEYVAGFVSELHPDRISDKEMLVMKRAILDTIGVGLEALPTAANFIADNACQVLSKEKAGGFATEIVALD